jgi:rhodanese-related sulfurtransferase
MISLHAGMYSKLVQAVSTHSRLLYATKCSVMVDVRTPGEARARPWKEENSVHIPIQDLVERLVELPTDHTVPIELFCGGTSRASLAKAFLEQAGYSDVRIHRDSAEERDG